MAPVFESVVDAIGGTPLFRLRGLGHGITAPVYAKAEFFSVGGSVKDRAALAMIEAAERDGTLRPGGTIVEATSGNTGIGLTIIGRQRGYQVKIVVSDRSAQEKTDILHAYGAEVIIGSSTLPRQHPDHLFNVARRLADDTPGGWLANQYDNPANPLAHVRTTGPEIWQQTEGRISHFVAGVGTGGTISGAGRYLKEASGERVRVIGADPENSTYSGGDGSPYYVESIGHFLHTETEEDVWPDSFHADVVDWFERVSDRGSLATVRRLAREDGLLVGPSSGTAVAAALRVARQLGPSDLVVVLLPDSGRSYLSKVFNDDWMRRWGFLEEPLDGTIGWPPTWPPADDPRRRPDLRVRRPAATDDRRRAVRARRAGGARPDRHRAGRGPRAARWAGTRHLHAGRVAQRSGARAPGGLRRGGTLISPWNCCQKGRAALQLAIRGRLSGITLCVLVAMDCVMVHVTGVLPSGPSSSTTWCSPNSSQASRRGSGGSERGCTTAEDRSALAGESEFVGPKGRPGSWSRPPGSSAGRLHGRWCAG
jgi:cystathionine beta-synthase